MTHHWFFLLCGLPQPLLQNPFLPSPQPGSDNRIRPAGGSTQASAPKLVFLPSTLSGCTPVHHLGQAHVEGHVFQRKVPFAHWHPKVFGVNPSTLDVSYANQSEMKVLPSLCVFGGGGVASCLSNPINTIASIANHSICGILLLIYIADILQGYTLALGSLCKPCKPTDYRLTVPYCPTFTGVLKDLILLCFFHAC